MHINAVFFRVHAAKNATQTEENVGASCVFEWLQQIEVEKKHPAIFIVEIYNAIFSSSLWLNVESVWQLFSHSHILFGLALAVEKNVLNERIVLRFELCSLALMRLTQS